MPPRPRGGSWDVYVVALKGGLWAATFTTVGWAFLDYLFWDGKPFVYYVHIWFPALAAASIALYQRENREWPLGDD